MLPPRERRELVAFARYEAGTPCWVDVSTPDLDATRKFYGGLFGWTAHPDPAREAGGCAMFALGEKHAAAAAAALPGQPPAWTTYIASDDVDATAARVAAAGGTVLAGPLDVSDAGRMLIARDPTGAAFGAWEAGTRMGAEVANTPGSLVWNELTTADAAAATAFLAQVFGYTVEPVDIGHAEPYRMLEVAGHPVAGVLQLTDEWGDVPSHWLTYFAVADTDAACGKVVELGGTVSHGPTDTSYGRTARVVDSTGAHFSVIAAADGTV
jgi:predicted enzyme related to lactoylglutathione lyase